MDQKSNKHGISRENSWDDDLNLQTAHKPGVTDLRPQSKTEQQPTVVIVSERHYQPPDTVNLMLQSFSPDILEQAPKPKPTGAQKQRDQRYIRHDCQCTNSTSTLATIQTTPGDAALDIECTGGAHCVVRVGAVQMYALLISLIRIDSALLRHSLLQDARLAELKLAEERFWLAKEKKSALLDVNRRLSVQAHDMLAGGVSDEGVFNLKMIEYPSSGTPPRRNSDEISIAPSLKRPENTTLESVSRWEAVPKSRTRFHIVKIEQTGKRTDTLTYRVKPQYFLKLTVTRNESALGESLPHGLPPRVGMQMCAGCWMSLKSLWVDSYSIDRLVASVSAARADKDAGDVSKLCKNSTCLCGHCVKLLIRCWLTNPVHQQYRSLAYLYTLIKIAVVNDDARQQTLEDSEHRVHRRCCSAPSLLSSTSTKTTSSVPFVRVYMPKFERRAPYHIEHATQNYHHYHTRWRDVLNAVSACASFLCCNRLQETMLRRNDVEDGVDGVLRKAPNDAQITDSWLNGGTYGSRTAVLVFRSSALAQSSEASIISKPGYKLHITFRVVQAETKLLAKLLECHGIIEASLDSNDFNLLWTGSHPKPGILRSMAPHQRVNHFPRSYELTRKDRLYKNIEKMQHAKGFKHFDFIPQTFLMPTEYRELCTTHHRVKGPWIVKPAASSRGRGIYIVESPNQVPIEEPVVVAKYISKPLLIKGHKCDLRLYVAVTSFDPLLVYIYEEGMVRFATVKYDTTHKQLWNPCMHLCNYSINKYHSDYVKSDDPSAENVGHKWTLSALLRHLKSTGKDTAHLMTQVEDLVIKAILACGNSIITACKMFVPNPYNCFELYGFDILIDENLKPWLLEVNLSPSLGCDSPLDVRLKSAMLSDLLTLVGIPAVDPMIKPPSPSSTSSTKSLKMKMSNCRRIHSAEGLSNHTLPKKSSKGSVTISNSSLTADDNKMIKNAKGQFTRRGGFVRIFPAVDSWAKYAQYLDPVCGIPIAGSSTSIPFSFMGQHNNNQILYKALYPEMNVVPTVIRPDKQAKLVHSTERRREGALDSVRRSEGPVSTPRQDRYERKLSQGHRSSLTAPKKPLKENYSAELKKQVCDMVKNGKKLSQVEARKAFSQYLVCVLKRISSSADQDGHIEIVLKFLQKASTYLKNPFYVKIPSHKLSEKDRAAIVAKQLNDFLYLYNRETDLYADLERPSQVPRNVFNEFLEHSSESDLEEVLILQNIHTVPNEGSADTNSTSSINSFQGLLRCLPSINSICFSSPEVTKKPVKVTPLS